MTTCSYVCQNGELCRRPASNTVPAVDELGFAVCSHHAALVRNRWNDLWRDTATAHGWIDSRELRSKIGIAFTEYRERRMTQQHDYGVGACACETHGPGMTVEQIRTAAGDANRAAGSMLRHTATNPLEAIATVENWTGGPLDAFRPPPAYDAERLRSEAHRHIAFAVLYMHHARLREASGMGGSEAPGGTP